MSSTAFASHLNFLLHKEKRNTKFDFEIVQCRPPHHTQVRMNSYLTNRIFHKAPSDFLDPISCGDNLICCLEKNDSKYFPLIVRFELEAEGRNGDSATLCRDVWYEMVRM